MKNRKDSAGLTEDLVYTNKRTEIVPARSIVCKLCFQFQFRKFAFPCSSDQKYWTNMENLATLTDQFIYSVIEFPQ